MVTKRELSNTVKLSVFESVFVPILTYGHESWVMTERIYSGASARDGIFAKTSRCGTGAHRGYVAPEERNKFGAPCSNLRSFGSKYNVLKKKIATFLEIFGAPY